MQISGSTATLLELLSTSTGARLIAPGLGQQGRGYLALIDGSSQRQPVRMYVEHRLRDLMRQCRPLFGRSGEFVLVRRMVVFPEQGNGSEPGFPFVGFQ